MLRPLALALWLCAPSAQAETYDLPTDPRVAAFVQANLIAVFYHEVGHALIDTLRQDMAGQEEDAADTLSALLIDRFWTEEAAEALVRDTALGFRLHAAEAQGTPGIRTAHAQDSARERNLVCLYFGAAPLARGEIARDLGLSAAERTRCPQVFRKAAALWRELLSGMPPQDHGRGFRLVVPADRDGYTALIARQIAVLNGEYGLPRWIDVTVERCGEANAFYDPRARRVVMCIDYAEDLARLYLAHTHGEGRDR